VAPDSDMGSRKDRELRQRSHKLEDVVNALEKRDNYKKAVTKAESDSKWLFEEDTEEDDLYKSLARARELAERERRKREEVIAEQVDKAVKDKREAKKKDTRLVFNTTTEFIKSVPTAPHGNSSDSGENMDVAEEEENHEETTKSIEAIQQMQKVRGKKRKRRNEEMDIETEEAAEDQVETNIKSENKSSNSQEKQELRDPIAEIIGEEALVSKSMFATIQHIRSRGGIQALAMEYPTGRASDKKVDNVNIDNDNVRIEYLDEQGRQMTPKEAFRRLSYRFHGKAPGKNKDEKRMKREAEELRRKMMPTADTPLMTLSAIQRTQKQTRQPYVIMGGNTTKILAQKVPLAGPTVTGPAAPEASQERGKSVAGTFREISIDHANSPKIKREEGDNKKEKVSFGFKQ